ncbi:adenosine deaminase [Nephila pilipes]|uniref:adenosine deaminase n=1 Tax=Nephila pilipes TaxID=299642 RepID=A0A8X6TD43_NEPPI|nr:adenosine deaminase [Nephila pilipes]
MEFRKNCFDPSKTPKFRVELHVHLDGAIRPETLWELSQRKGLFLHRSQEELRRACVVESPSDLPTFLRPITEYLPLVAGDAETIERIAFEFCEDAALQYVLYVEVRYSPHLMASEDFPPSKVVESVNRGLERGRRAFGIDVRSILCSIRGRPGWSREVVQLCREYQDSGVVAIDIAGDANGVVDTSVEDVEAFQVAYQLGIHRTVHAGEDGPADQVKFALDQLHAERIGHGYHVVENDALYRRCLDSRVHLESCPHSSLLTGAVMNLRTKHPIVRYAEDGANFSINRDDPTLIQKTLDDDYALLRSMGLSDVHFARANFNAAHSAFLPAEEKNELLQKLRRVYGAELKCLKNKETGVVTI